MRVRFVLIGAAVLAVSLAPGRDALAQVATCGGSVASCGQLPANNTGYGTTAAEFLLLAPDARGTALGGSFAVLATDVSAVYYNPAGLSQMQHPGAMASTMNYVAGTKYAWAAVGFPMSGGARAIGVQVANFGFSNQPVYTLTDPSGTSGAVYSVSETVVGLTFSQQFSDRFSAGLTAKLVNDQLGEVSGKAFAVDFGTSFHAVIGGRPIRASFVIQNLGSTLSHSGQALATTVFRPAPQGQQDVPQEGVTVQEKTKDWPLPVTFRVGLAYDLFQTSAGRLTLLGEFTQPNNNTAGFDFGGEYGVSLGSSGFSVAGRASVAYVADNNASPPASGAADYAGFSSTVGGTSKYRMSAGGGVFYRPGTEGFGVGIDYAYKNLGLLGGVNMISVGFTW